MHVDFAFFAERPTSHLRSTPFPYTTLFRSPGKIVLSNDPGVCGAAVSYPAPVVLDNCDPNPTVGCNPQSDRKSTRLNSSHLGISYAVFCLKKKKGITV